MVNLIVFRKGQTRQQQTRCSGHTKGRDDYSLVAPGNSNPSVPLSRSKLLDKRNLDLEASSRKIAGQLPPELCVQHNRVLCYQFRQHFVSCFNFRRLAKSLKNEAQDIMLSAGKCRIPLSFWSVRGMNSQYFRLPYRHASGVLYLLR